MYNIAPVMSVVPFALGVVQKHWEHYIGHATRGSLHNVEYIQYKMHAEQNICFPMPSEVVKHCIGAISFSILGWVLWGSTAKQ